MNNIVPALSIFLLSSALYAFIGYSLGKKSFADAADAKAWRAFRVWWFAMAIDNLVNAARVSLFAAGFTSVTLHVTLNLVNTLFAAAALWGLLTYLLYVFTGRARVSTWVGIFYIAFAAFLFYSVYVFHPIGVTLGDWETAITYQNPPAGIMGLAYVIFFLLLIALPPVLASIGMFTLYFRVKERSSKYRALVVPLGIFGLFGLAYLVPLVLFPFGVRTGDLAWWPFTIRIVGLLALLVIYWAYFPPTFIQKSLRVSPVTG